MTTSQESNLFSLSTSNNNLSVIGGTLIGYNVSVGDCTIINGTFISKYRFGQKDADFAKDHIDEINMLLYNPIMNPHLHDYHKQSTTDTYYKMGYRDPEYVSYKVTNQDNRIYVNFINGENIPITCIDEDKYIMYALHCIINTLMVIENTEDDDVYKIKYPISQDYILLYLLKQMKKNEIKLNSKLIVL